MGALAVFGIENDGLNLAVNLLLLFLVVIWLALIYWTWADARRRIEDPMLVACATAASLFPFVGHDRLPDRAPPEYLEDVRERELEIAAAEARLASLDHLHCQYCGFEVEKAFLRCPSCLRRLKEPCTRVRQAARPALEDLPLLRGRGGPGARRSTAPARPPAPPRPRRPAAGRAAARAARQARPTTERQAAASNDRPRSERPARAPRERPRLDPGPESRGERWTGP